MSNIRAVKGDKRVSIYVQRKNENDKAQIKNRTERSNQQQGQIKSSENRKENKTTQKRSYAV